MCEIDRPLRLGSTDKLARGNGLVQTAVCLFAELASFVTRLRAGQPRNRISIPIEEKKINLLIRSRPSVEPTHPHIQWTERVKRPKPENDPSHV